MRLCMGARCKARRENGPRGRGTCAPRADDGRDARPPRGTKRSIIFLRPPPSGPGPPPASACPAAAARTMSRVSPYESIVGLTKLGPAVARLAPGRLRGIRELPPAGRHCGKPPSARRAARVARLGGSRR